MKRRNSSVAIETTIMPPRSRQPLRQIRGTAIFLIAPLFVLAVGLCPGTGAVAQTPAAKRQEKAAGSGEAKARAPGGARPKQTNDQPGRIDAYGDPLPARAVLRLGTTRFRHNGEACCLVYSPDGKFLAGKSQDGVITLWDARTGVPQRRIQTPFKDTRFAFSPDSRMLASAGDRRHIYFWDVATEKFLRKIALPDALVGDCPSPGDNGYRIRFSPDGKRLSLGGASNCCVLDAVLGKVLHHFNGDGAGSNAAWSPDGQTLALGVSTDSPSKAVEIQVRSVRTGKVLRRLAGHSDTIDDIRFSPDGKRLASGSREQIIVWDALTGKALHNIAFKADYVQDLAFTPDGKTLLSCPKNEGAVHVWDVRTGKERRRLDARMSDLRSMALSPDGKTVAGGFDNTNRLWDLATGRELFAEQQGHDGFVHSVAYSPDGKRLVSGGEDGQVCIWDARIGKRVRQLAGARFCRVRFSLEGRRIALFSTHWKWDYRTCIRDLTTWEEQCHLPQGSDGNLTALAFSPDGNTLVTAERSLAENGQWIGHLNVWDANTGRRLHHWLVKGLIPECLAVHPEGKTLAVGGYSAQGNIRLWDLRRGKEIQSLQGEAGWVRSLAFSPDGRTLVSGGHYSGAPLWETATGKKILLLEVKGRSVVAVAFSPNARVVAAGGFNTVMIGAYKFMARATPIRLWDVSTGAALPPLEGPDCIFTSLAFSPDGSRLASGLLNSTVLLWEAPQGMVPPKGAPLPGAGELAALWSALAGEDAGKAHAAGWKLTAAAEAAVPYLTRHLTPAPAVDPKCVRKLIADLDSNRFAVRETASRELEGLGQAADPILREAVAGKPPLEVYRRLEKLLTRTGILGPGEELRGVRAAGVLERIATPAAQRLLERLAKGAPEARLTQEAKASLQRITCRTVERKRR